MFAHCIAGQHPEFLFCCFGFFVCVLCVSCFLFVWKWHHKTTTRVREVAYCLECRHRSYKKAYRTRYFKKLNAEWQKHVRGGESCYIYFMLLPCMSLLLTLVETEDWVVGIFPMRHSVLSYVIEQYIPHIFTRTDIFSGIRKIVKSNL